MWSDAHEQSPFGEELVAVIVGDREPFDTTKRSWTWSSAFGTDARLPSLTVCSTS